MAKLVLALDKSGFRLTDKQIEDYLLSGVDGIKLTAASLFNRLYDWITCFYITKNYPRYLDVFMDLKVADISFGDNEGTNFKIASAIADSPVCPVTHISMHGFMGKQAIREMVSGGSINKKGRLKILVLCAMTDPNYARFIDASATEDLYTWAAISGADGLILPANNLTHIQSVRKATAFDKLCNIPIWSPGFGRQNEHRSLDDQLKGWRSEVGDNPENAAILGTHLLEHPNLKEEVSRIKEIIK